MAAVAIGKRRAKYLLGEPVRVSPKDDADADANDDGLPQRRRHIRDVGRAAAFVSAVQTSASQAKDMQHRQGQGQGHFVRTASQILQANAAKQR